LTVRAENRCLMRCLLYAACAGALMLQAQTEDKGPAFEVASVRRSASGRVPDVQFKNGRLSASSVPLAILVSIAYNVPFQGPRLKGIDPELGMETYDIQAMAAPGLVPEGASQDASIAKLRPMLQVLLKDRFRLKIQAETGQQSVYQLIVGKSGPRLQKAKLSESECAADQTRRCHRIGGGQGRGIHATAVDIGDLVRFVENWTDRPLLDKTGLTGLYDIETDGWVPLRPRMPTPGSSPENDTMSDPTRPTLYMIFERLGLKMESSKAPVEMFVVEHLGRPTEN